MSTLRIFRDFKTSPEIIRLAVMMDVRYPLSLRTVEDLLHERGIDITHETVRFWWNRFGTIFAAEIWRRRVDAMRHFRHRRWHLNEVFAKINGVKHYLWRAVDHEGEVLESDVTKKRDKKAALKLLRKSLRRHGGTAAIVTDRLASYGRARPYGSGNRPAPETPQSCTPLVKAPSMTRFVPVVKDDAGLDRNTTPRAISSAVAMRPVGLRSSAVLNRSGILFSMCCQMPPSK
jgi:putative transposase